MNGGVFVVAVINLIDCFEPNSFDRIDTKDIVDVISGLFNGQKKIILKGVNGVIKHGKMVCKNFSFFVEYNYTALCSMTMICRALQKYCRKVEVYQLI